MIKAFTQNRNKILTLIVGLILLVSFAVFQAKSAGKNKSANRGNIVAIPDIDLPEDKGKEEVEAYCSSCHSMRLVVQQGMSRKQWKELLEWMTEEQEMDKIPDDDEKLVLDYLSKHLSVEEYRKRFKR